MPAEQNAQLILLLHDLPLDVRDRRRRIGERRFGPRGRELVADAADELTREEVERLLERIGCALGDLQLQIELAELEISLGDVRDHSEHDSAADVFAREQIGQRGFGRAANSPPYIDLPGHLERTEEDVAGIVPHARRDEELATLRLARVA